MTSKKEQFLTQYLLNRALARPDGFDSELAARGAILAWDYIQRDLKKRPE